MKIKDRAKQNTPDYFYDYDNSNNDIFGNIILRKSNDYDKSEFRTLSRTAVTTEKAIELQEKVKSDEYERNAKAFTENRLTKEKSAKKKREDNIAKNKKFKHSGSTNNIISSGSTAKNAAVGSKVAQNVIGKVSLWQSIAGLADATTPEILRAQNYTVRKNAERLRYLSEGPSGNYEGEAASKFGGIFTRLAGKVGEIWRNGIIVLFHVNGWAGLAALLLSFILLFVIFGSFMIFSTELGYNNLPNCVYNSGYKLRQLMTSYEYYWDCVNTEASASAEAGLDCIVIPVELQSEGSTYCGENTAGKNFINWREVLVVYCAYIKGKNFDVIPDSELPDVPVDKSVVSSLFSAENTSLFNEVFWTMNCVMPAGNELIYDIDAVPELTNDRLKHVKFNVCYRPSLDIVEKRLGFDLFQKSFVDEFLSEEYDFFFDSLISTRYVSSSDIVAQTAAAEIGTHGSKYCSYFNTSGAWCCYFVNWVLDNTGNSKFIGTGGVTSSFDIWRNNPSIATIHYCEMKDPDTIPVQPGWLVIIEHGDHDAYRDHIGIAESYNPETHVIRTVEGNAGSDYVKYCYRDLDDCSRLNQSHVYALVELKYPNSQGVLPDRYDNNYTANREYSSAYPSICEAVNNYIANHEKAQKTLRECMRLLAYHGTAEWNLTELNNLQSTSTTQTLAAYIRTSCDSNSLPDSYLRWPDVYNTLPSYMPGLKHYYIKYAEYYRKRIKL